MGTDYDMAMAKQAQLKKLASSSFSTANSSTISSSSASNSSSLDSSLVNTTTTTSTFTNIHSSEPASLKHRLATRETTPDEGILTDEDDN